MKDAKKESQDPLLSFRVDKEIYKQILEHAKSKEVVQKYGIEQSASQAARDLMLEALTRRRSEFKRPK